MADLPFKTLPFTPDRSHSMPDCLWRTAASFRHISSERSSPDPNFFFFFFFGSSETVRFLFKIPGSLRLMGECTNPGEEMNYALFGTCAGLLLYQWDDVAALRDPGPPCRGQRLRRRDRPRLLSFPSPHFLPPLEPLESPGKTLTSDETSHFPRNQKRFRPFL